jgi:hypothetical protein
MRAQSTDRTILFGSSLTSPHHNGSVTYPAPSERVRTILLQVYRERVDCLYKALHWPSVLAEIHRLHSDEVNFHKASLHKVTPGKALEFSIYFMSLCSMKDEETTSFGLGDRPSLIEQYRDAAEQTISATGLLQSPTVTSLQAFVIYLVGIPQPNAIYVALDH